MRRMQWNRPTDFHILRCEIADEIDCQVYKSIQLSGGEGPRGGGLHWVSAQRSRHPPPPTISGLARVRLLVFSISDSMSVDESNIIGDWRIQSVDEDSKNVTVAEWCQKTGDRTALCDCATTAATWQSSVRVSHSPVAYDARIGFKAGA